MRVFLEKSRKKLQLIHLKKNIVLALGGVLFLNRNVRNEILKKHLSFWLYLNEFNLIQRIKNNLKDLSPLNQLKKS